MLTLSPAAKSKRFIALGSHKVATYSALNKQATHPMAIGRIADSIRL
jgi:hypothetical protein